MKDYSKTDWEEFCDFVKYRKRYFFHNEVIKDQPRIQGGTLIWDLASQLCDYPFSLNVGEKIYRCGPNPSSFETNDIYSELGPPPSRNARANRMSAAGISMFYTANSPKTALLETANKRGIFGVAEFTIRKDIALLDLTNLSQLEDKRFSTFMSDLVEDMTKPLERDGLEHIDYVPTQIFTECFSSNW